MITNYRTTATKEWMPILPELWNTNTNPVRTYTTDNTINIDGLVGLDKLFEDFNTVPCEDPILDSKIEITHHGKTTVALRKDSTGHVTNRGVARCNPCDSFNHAVGSMIALIRLLSSEVSINWYESDEIGAEICSLID